MDSSLCLHIVLHDSCQLHLTGTVRGQGVHGGQTQMRLHVSGPSCGTVQIWVYIIRPHRSCEGPDKSGQEGRALCVMQYWRWGVLAVSQAGERRQSVIDLN